MMTLRSVGLWLALSTLMVSSALAQTQGVNPNPQLPDPGSARSAEMLSRWKANLLRESGKPVCQQENGEEIGWLISPLLSGDYFGYLATRDTMFVKLAFACMEALMARAVREPDDYPGWPKIGASGTPVDDLDKLDADSLLGEAMALRPIVLLSKRVLDQPELRSVFGADAEKYIAFSETIYEKWRDRGAWRDTQNGGAISIVAPFGLRENRKGWTDLYGRRTDIHVGFSHPDNKANLVARWLLAMFDATGKAMYKQQAEKWFVVMKSRLVSNGAGGFIIWNYWQPAGPWDFQADGRAKHWIGVHPNAGYYDLDVGGIVDAYQHGVVFDAQDMAALVTTALAEKRYWPALVTYNETIRGKVEDQIEPDSWQGLYLAPWRLALQAGVRSMASP